MGTIEEAASLFGSPEADSDIFGSVGGSDSGLDISSPMENGDAHTNPNVDVLFGGASAHDELDQTPWVSSDTSESYDLHPSDYLSPGDSHQNPQQQAGWSNQWNSYGHPGAQDAAQESYYNDQAYFDHSRVNQPYQPPAQHPSYPAYDYTSTSESQNVYSPLVSQTSDPQYGSWNGQQDAYDPYKPASTLSSSYPIIATTSSTYTSTATTTSSVYDAYKPVDRSQPPNFQPPSTYPQSYSYPTSGRPQVTSTNITHSAPVAQIIVPPVPPEVVTAPYRPKALNAYDPPLPPPKPKRSHVQPASQTQSPYSSYVLPPSTNMNVSPVAPAHASPNTYDSNSIQGMVPPPPARKVAGPSTQQVPNDSGYSNYEQMNRDQHPLSATNEAGHKPHSVTAVSPQVPHLASKFGSPSQSIAFEQDTEFYEDPEGGRGNTLFDAETPSLQSDSGYSLNSSWSSGNGTVTPRTAFQDDFKLSSAPSTLLEANEGVGHQYHLSDEPTSITSPSVLASNLPDPYRPNGPKVDSPHLETQQLSYDYRTSPSVNPVRIPSSAPVRSQTLPYDTKSPSHKSYNVNPAQPYDSSVRMRSSSNSVSPNHVDSYSPPRYPHQLSNGSADYGSLASRYKYPERPSSTASDKQGTLNSTPLAAAYPSYAPSPSLLGTNDPLGRVDTRIPVFSFGFGGKVATCFHGASKLQTGFDVALSSRQSRDISIRSLHAIVPQSALEDTSATYPGPLFLDPGSLAIGIVRPGAAAQAKSKKVQVINYLEERVQELSRGVAYLGSGLLERGRAEGKLTLVTLLKIMVENDGCLSRFPDIDASVRAALIPRLADSGDRGTERFSTPADGFGGVAATTETPLTVHTLKPSHLDAIQNMLQRGQRHQAYHYALDEKLWAHAMVIASSIDKESWQEVANEFIRTELDIKNVKSSGVKRGNAALPDESNGRESLRVAYSLYAGQGAAAVQALLPTKPLVKMGENMRIPHAPSTNFLTPQSPSLPGPTMMANISPDVLAKWTETAAMMISSPMSLETSSALTALGDCLFSNQWIEAAHACYLLSPQTSPFGGIGTPSARIVLLGSASPQVYAAFSKDSDPVIFSEIAEFALSLATPPKGQDPFGGMQHLQPYKLIRAHQLAEMGHVNLATRYCQAITTSISRGSPYFTPTFLDQLSGLTEQLIAAPSLDKGGSWMGSKMPRPSLDKIGNWLEGRLTKFIAGEGDNLPSTDEHQSDALQSQGPFSHYSSISSATHSADPSPYASTTNLVSMSSIHPPPARSGSAMAMRSSTGSPHMPVNRASSAMDHVRPHDVRSSKPAYSLPNGYGSPYVGTSSGLTTKANSPTNLDDTIKDDGVYEGGSPWWGSSYNNGFNSRTPTATFFARVPENNPDSSGFISLMDDAHVGPAPVPSNYRNNSLSLNEEDDDDLGLGNNPVRSKEATPSNETNSSVSSEKQTVSRATNEDTSKPDSKTATTGSWLSKWWKKDPSTAPIKANLGEETAFYYDKELKRWVNKKTTTEVQKQTLPPPPPPNRSQTTSPGRSGSFTSPGLPPAPPPARPASAIDLTSPPKKIGSRVRSNLIPEDGAFVPPTVTSDALPPPSRPRSGASKKPVRSRYVDVFQQQLPTAGS